MCLKGKCCCSNHAWHRTPLPPSSRPPPTPSLFFQTFPSSHGTLSSYVVQTNARFLHAHAHAHTRHDCAHARDKFMNHWCTNQPGAGCKERRDGAVAAVEGRGEGEKQAVKVFPLKAFKGGRLRRTLAAVGRGASTHPAGLRARVSQDDAVFFRPPYPTLRLLPPRSLTFSPPWLL